MCSEAGLNLVEIGQFLNALPFPNGVKNQSLCREYTLPRDEKETCANDGSKAMHESILCVEIKVPSLFEYQNTSWIRIVHGVEKYVREARPIQEEERSSEKPAAKGRDQY